MQNEAFIRSHYEISEGYTFTPRGEFQLGFSTKIVPTEVKIEAESEEEAWIKLIEKFNETINKFTRGEYDSEDYVPPEG